MLIHRGRSPNTASIKKNDGATVGVRGGEWWWRGLGLTLLGELIVSPQQGKPKAPLPIHTAPYPYLPQQDSRYLNGIGPACYQATGKAAGPKVNVSSGRQGTSEGDTAR